MHLQSRRMTPTCPFVARNRACPLVTHATLRLPRLLTGSPSAHPHAIHRATGRIYRPPGARRSRGSSRPGQVEALRRVTISSCESRRVGLPRSGSHPMSGCPRHELPPAARPARHPHRAVATGLREPERGRRVAAAPDRAAGTGNGGAFGGDAVRRQRSPSAA